MSGTQAISNSKAAARHTAVDTTGAQQFYSPGKKLRRWLYTVLVLVTSAAGGWMMLQILRANGLTALELVLLLLFISTFTWVVAAFWNAIIGFMLLQLRRNPYTLRRRDGESDTISLRTRTAVVMPVYNENTRRIIAGFESNIRSLKATGHSDAFDFYLLSDTQDPQLAEAEQQAWQLLMQRLGRLRRGIYYRRRQQNQNRKVGNIADFCQRWGTNYDYMIVLDADSLMSGDCMVKLASRMEANPDAGLIQTIPMPVRQQTFFGRFIQFAASLYSPLLATGSAFWQTDNCNYWGHNAIIRISAFMQCCGLPNLPGRPPFGGEILSHDFVEAALLYRGGWSVYLATELDGSYEEVPANIVDYVKRDRRWVQGNLQHLGLLNSSGISVISRLHFLFGALAYISSLAWLCMLIFSSIDAILRATRTQVFFSDTYQLFPNWPTVESGIIVALLYLTIFILFLPKVLGCIHCLLHRSEAFGGKLPLLANAVLELLFAVLVAPLMMCYHAYFVLNALLGFNIRWDAQARQGRLVSWREAWQRSYVICLAAAIWAVCTAHFSELFFYFLSPVLLGMLFAPLIIRFSSYTLPSKAGKRSKYLSSPTEFHDDPTISTFKRIFDATPSKFKGPAEAPLLTPVQWQEMPIQSLKKSRSRTPYFKKILPN